MPTRQAVVGSLVGLHARPAAAFVRAVIDSGFPVTISKAGASTADARSLLEVMAADFQYGCTVQLAIEAATLSSHRATEAERVLSALAALLESPQAADDRSRPDSAGGAMPAAITGCLPADPKR